MNKEELEDQIIDNLSFNELIALKFNIPQATDEESSFDGGFIDFRGMTTTDYVDLDEVDLDGESLDFRGMTTTDYVDLDELEDDSSFLGFGSDNEDDFSEFNKKARQKAANKFKGGIKKVGGAIKKVGDKIGDTKIARGVKKSKVGGGIVSGLQKAGTGLKNLGQKAGKVIKKVGDKVGDVARKVGRGVVVATMSIPRASARGLIAINFRGFGTRIMESGGSNNKGLMDKWYKLGGTPSKLIISAKKGAPRKPLVCGQKCKEKMVGKANSNFTGDSYSNAIGMYKDARDELDYASVDPGTATLLATGGAVLGTIGSFINTKINNKTQRAALDLAEKQGEADAQARANELGVTKDQLEKQYDLAEKQVMLQADPIALIQNNPNLTPAQKQEAIKQAREVLSVSSASKFKKIALYGGLALLVAFIGLKIYKNSKK